MSAFVGLPTQGRTSLRTRYPDIRFRAVFLRQGGSTIVAEATSSGNKHNDVIQASTTKQIGNPMGVYSLTLVPRGHDYQNVITPGDWCVIEADNGAGLGWQTVMYGPVSAIRKNVVVGQSGRTQTSVVVSGADFGKPFLSTSAFEDSLLAKDPAFSALSLASISTQLSGLIGNPGEIVESVLSAYLNTGIDQWVDPVTDKTFGTGWFQTDYIDKNLKGKTIISSTFSLAGNLWQTLQQFQNPSINEMFVDFRPPYDDQNNIINLEPALVLRQYPFWGNDWNFLPGVVIDDDEIINDNTSKSDDDVKNWIRSVDDPSLTGSRAGIVPYLPIGLLNQNSIKRFGFRRLESPTQYLLDPDTGKPIQDLVEDFTSLQALWHHSNEEFLAGNLTTYFRPDIRVGYRLTRRSPLSSSYMEYYVEGVQHALNFPGQSSTVLTVTRGRDSNNELFQKSLEQLLDAGILEGIGTVSERIMSGILTGGLI